ncbi:BlsF (plasmid) [Corynebacterium jeikeium K411]|uniref:BlsF n=1 Tax=Corynebacterium jeikeium (strain K411) TaxID=306537 RepID=Q93MK2_CORJK|nr:PH domain-containing protein [Corynebacterium jeikeium]AAK94045.1 BlsF [Corynebacterium jeikeium K411]
MELKNSKRGILLEIVSLLPNSIPVYSILFGFMFVADGVWFGTLVVSAVYYSWTRVYRILISTVGISGWATDAGISIGRGISSKRYISSKWAGVSGVEIEENLLLRWLGCKRLKVYFAGSSLETAVFCCLSPENAYAVRDRFRLVSIPDDAPDRDSTAVSKFTEEAERGSEVSLSGFRLGVAALSSGRFLLVLPFLLSVTNTLGISFIGEESIGVFVSSGGVLAATLKVFLTSLSLVAVGIVFFVVLYHGWSVCVSGGGIRVSYGSFNRKDTVVHAADVQAVFLTRTIAYSAVKAWRLSVQCRSSDEGSRVRLISPLIRDTELDDVLDKLGVRGSRMVRNGISSRSVSLASHCRSAIFPFVLLVGSCCLCAQLVVNRDLFLAGAIVSAIVACLFVVWLALQSASIGECANGHCILSRSGLFRFRVCVFYLDSIDSWKVVEWFKRNPVFSLFILGFNVSGIKKRVFASRSAPVSRNIADALEAGVT